jgi:heptosyltransferase-1
MKVLIVKLGSIGDIVHTLPALAALRAGLPNSEISWVAETSCSEILKDNPVLDRLIEVDTKALRRGLMSGETLRAPRQQLRRLRASTFDVALDFQGLIKSASIARLSGARRVFGYSRSALREPASSVFLSKRISIPPQTHVIRKGLLLVQGALGRRRSLDSRLARRRRLKPNRIERRTAREIILRFLIPAADGRQNCGARKSLAAWRICYGPITGCDLL